MLTIGRRDASSAESAEGRCESGPGAVPANACDAVGDCACAANGRVSTVDVWDSRIEGATGETLRWWVARATCTANAGLEDDCWYVAAAAAAELTTLAVGQSERCGQVRATSDRLIPDAPMTPGRTSFETN